MHDIGRLADAALETYAEIAQQLLSLGGMVELAVHVAKLALEVPFTARRDAAHSKQRRQAKLCESRDEISRSSLGDWNSGPFDFDFSHLNA